MYTIEKKDFGFKLVFGDFIKADEMKKWLDESRKHLAGAPREFGVFVDMRTLRPLPADSQAFMEEGQKLYRQKGMARSVVILDSKVVTLQFRRIARETGIYEWERYIDASDTPDWEKIGLAWIRDGKDPDK